jgi:hypothetical protein
MLNSFTEVDENEMKVHLIAVYRITRFTPRIESVGRLTPRIEVMIQQPSAAITPILPLTRCLQTGKSLVKTKEDNY